MLCGAQYSPATSNTLLKFNNRSEEVSWWKRHQTASVGPVIRVAECPLAPWFALVPQTFGENVMSSHRAGTASCDMGSACIVCFLLFPRVLACSELTQTIINISPPLLKRRGDTRARIQRRALPGCPSCQLVILVGESVFL